jgi:hypothetical protein
MNESDFKDLFWTRVRDCLVQIHGFDSTRAEKECKQYSNKFPSSPDDEPSLVYHLEPFDLACDIAGEKISFTKNKAIYFQILQSTNAEDAQLRAIPEIERTARRGVEIKTRKAKSLLIDTSSGNIPVVKESAAGRKTITAKRRAEQDKAKKTARSYRTKRSGPRKPGS